MSYKSSRANNAFNPFGRFFADAAENFGRAREARDIMGRSEGYFESRGTTREKAIRGVFGI